MAVHLGHVHDGYMVNLTADNIKLRERAARIVSAISACDIGDAAKLLEASGGSVKSAILLAAGAPSAEKASEILESNQQRLRPALSELKGSLWLSLTALLIRVQQETKMGSTTLKTLLMATSILATAGFAHAADTTLTIESWRTDDLAIWQEKLIPAFEAKNPGIKVKFAPTPPTEYDAALGARFDAGSAGDIITCRPFDKSLEQFKRGNLASLNDLPGMKNFSDVAKSAWTTDDGKDTFCVPMASVIHGFIYNKDAFDKLGIAIPTTEAEFFAALDKIKADGTYIPMAMGTKDLWEAATMGYQNIGPTYWKGEEGRAKLIKGEAKADRSLNGSSLTRFFSSGRIISATVSKLRPIRTARICSLSAVLRSIRPVRGKSACSIRRPSSRWEHSRRR